MEKRSLLWDLVEEILSRVPTKPLARFRSISKQWNALLKSGNFAKKHTANAPKESLVIMLIRSRVFLMRINLREPSGEAAAQFHLKDSLSDSSQVYICNVFHCEGLLLCTTEDNRLVVWNPCTEETKWVRTRGSCKESDYFALGYDNSSSCKKYKILRVDRQDDISTTRPNRIKNVYEIYDFASNSWRAVGVATDWFLARSRRGISVKGNTYWVATQAEMPHAELLLSFDFSTETFQTMSLPLPNPFPYASAALSVVGDEQLCLLCTTCKSRMIGNVKLNDSQVWMANGTGSVRSWSKSLAVAYYRGKNGSNWMSFWLDEQKEVVMYLSPNNILQIVGEVKHANTHIVDDNVDGDSIFMSSCSVLLNYVPSLAQIQQGGGRKRKAPSTCDL